MKNKASDNARLGLFVMAGLVFMIVTLYMIGKNRNLLGSTFTIKAVVTNVNGLVAGNNVRFKGIDVGTVKQIRIFNDTAIHVVMSIDNKMRRHIKQNALASIGTDGLMGNKLININSQPGDAPPVEEGDVIQSLKPIETDEMLRTLNVTNRTIEKVTQNLQQITEKLNSSNSLWNILSDSSISVDLKAAMASFHAAGSNAAKLTADAEHIIERFDKGKGVVNTLFTDTVLNQQLYESLAKIQQAGDETSILVKDLRDILGKIKEGEGTAGLLLKDSALRSDVIKSIENVEQGTARFNENMEAMKSNFLFRRYFKKLEKEKNKKTASSKSN